MKFSHMRDLAVAAMVTFVPASAHALNMAQSVTKPAFKLSFTSRNACIFEQINPFSPTPISAMVAAKDDNSVGQQFKDVIFHFGSKSAGTYIVRGNQIIQSSGKLVGPESLDPRKNWMMHSYSARLIDSCLSQRREDLESGRALRNTLLSLDVF